MMQIKTMEINETFNIVGNHEIKVEEGLIWITYQNDIKDYFFRAGETFKVNSNRPALVEALQKSEFVFLD